jgi:hypothetical protein
MMQLASGRELVSVPYSLEINDKPAYEKRNRTADEFRDMIVRQFEVLYEEGAQSGRVMAISLHPYLSGVPHRIGALDAALEAICRRDGVWRATGSEIAHEFRTVPRNPPRSGRTRVHRPRQGATRRQKWPRRPSRRIGLPSLRSRPSPPAVLA